MELLLVIVFVFFPLCILVGVAGKNRNIGFWGAFWISFLFSPIVGILFTLISSKKKKVDPYEELKKLEYLKSQNMIDDKKYEEKKAQIKALISKALILVVSNILFLSCNLVDFKTTEEKLVGTWTVVDGTNKDMIKINTKIIRTPLTEKTYTYIMMDETALLFTEKDKNTLIDETGRIKLTLDGDRLILVSQIPNFPLRLIHKKLL